MSTRHQRNHKVVLLVITLVTVLTGCASSNDLVRDGTLNVERIASDRAHVSFLYVRQESEGISIQGKVSSRFLGHGLIPGHIHIVLIDPKGDILSDTQVKYTLISVKGRFADFYVQIPTEPLIGSTLRVSHHYSTQHHTE